jgi:geranylgeranyl transferase type-1 subunit beta
LGAAAENEDEASAAFKDVERTKLLRWLKGLQREDGSFGQNIWDGEVVGGRDMRHSYLASCIRWMLRGDVKEGEDAWVEDVNVDEMIAHIRRGQVGRPSLKNISADNFQTYDGGVAESSQHESHGTLISSPTLGHLKLTSPAGYAYCAIGALSLLDRPLDSTSAHPPESALKQGIPNREGLLQFLASRQFAYLAKEEEEDEVEENFLESKLGETNFGHVGLNGRWNKKADTCYCWWVGGTLAVSPLLLRYKHYTHRLDARQLIHHQRPSLPALHPRHHTAPNRRLLQGCRRTTRHVSRIPRSRGVVYHGRN